MNIKELRISKNLSQTELGNIVGVERSAVCLWEKGGRQPDIQALWKMADYFGVSVDYLIGRISKAILFISVARTYKRKGKLQSVAKKL